MLVVVVIVVAGTAGDVQVVRVVVIAVRTTPIVGAGTLTVERTVIAGVATIDRIELARIIQSACA